jgi:hypothetical protein
MPSRLSLRGKRILAMVGVNWQGPILQIESVVYDGVNHGGSHQNTFIAPPPRG